MARLFSTILIVSSGTKRRREAEARVDRLVV
jgi:hypothetical protein